VAGRKWVVRAVKAGMSRGVGGEGRHVLLLWGGLKRASSRSSARECPEAGVLGLVEIYFNFFRR
jgi:hypothetical protein